MKPNASRFAMLFAAAFTLSLFAASHTQAAPGDLDLTFGNGGIVVAPQGAASAVAIQSDGKIVAVGVGDGVGIDFALARYNTDGSLDNTFGSGGVVLTFITDSHDYANAVAIQSDGKIVAAGYSYIGPFYTPSFALVRYNTNGSLDTTFGTGGIVLTLVGDSSYASAIAIQSDGNIVAVGSSDDRFALVRYKKNGSLDTSFGTGGIILTSIGIDDRAKAVAIQSDGKIVAAGYTSPDTETYFALARYNTDGSLDISFGTSGIVLTPINNSSGVAAVTIQPDSKIVAAGSGYIENSGKFALARYNSDGSLDTTFGAGGIVATLVGESSAARAAAIQSNGKIIAAGYDFTGSNFEIALARYNTDGSLDISFGTGGKVLTHIGSGTDAASAVAIQRDGRIVTAGFSNVVTFGAFALVRYLGGSVNSVATVTRSDDRNNATCVPGDCSLREAVNAANASETDDTINFASGLTTVTLTNEIVINNAGTLTINGPGANELTLDGGLGMNRIFYTDRATVIIFGMTLTGGNGGNGNGGAIHAIQGSLMLDGVQVIANSAQNLRYGDYPNGGGGVYYIGGTHRIVNSTFFANIGNECGGGILNLGELTIVNSTISGNTAEGGGGICIYFGVTELRNVTITNNTAFGGELYSNGGGILNSADYPFSAPLNFGNTVVAGNTSTNGIAPDISFIHGSITSVGGNLVGDSPGDSTNTGRAIAYHPTDIRDTNPMLGALQNNGGTTPTHALLARSPVIDKGLNALVSPLASVFDQRGSGFPRIRDGNGDRIRRVDIGAFEVQLGLIGPTPFDFDGDGRSDISVFRPSDRVWYLDRSQAGFYATQFGLSADKVVPGDYDGDGKTDIAVYRDGTWYWLNSSNNGFNAKQFGLSGDIPVAADYTGDGRDELAVYRGGVWYTLDPTNNLSRVVHFGLSTDKPVVSDYDGDGKADQAVYRGGIWYLNRSSLGFAAVQFGLPNDKLVPADYDSDGQCDLAVYRDGTWYVLGSQTGFTSFRFGISTDIPIPADYDGDGKTDAAVYRDGLWYVQQSTSGLRVHQFGLANDIPLPGR